MMMSRSLIALALIGGFALPAAAMDSEQIAERLSAQLEMKSKKMEPASAKTEDGEEAAEAMAEGPTNESGYAEIPFEARIDLLGLKFNRANTSVAKASHSTVDALCDAMKSMETLPSIHLIGHTDKSGSEEVNMRVSNKRAEAVRKYIVDECGIPNGLMLTSGEGETYAPQSTPSNEPMDRRVEVQVIG